MNNMEHTDRATQVKNTFKTLGRPEGLKFELDNLDWAQLVCDARSEWEVVVENEHGSRFEVEELNETELTVIENIIRNEGSTNK